MHRDTVRNYGQKTERASKNDTFGKFVNFPIVTHGIVKVTYSDQLSKIQRSIIQALQKLNGSKGTYQMSSSGRAGTYKGRVGYEVGVAEGIYFTYLDDDLAKRMYNFIASGKLFSILDFLVIVTYHYNFHGKTINLNFDHHQLRFIFRDNGFEMQLFHSRGTRRMPLDEFVNRILHSVNRALKQRSLKPLKIQELKVL